METSLKNWWLLAFCGVLDATISVAYFLLQDASGLRFPARNSAIAMLGKLILAAGVCTIAAGVWGSLKRKCRLLALNGLALAALGMLHELSRFRIGFRAVALLVVVMAMSSGILTLRTARALRSERPEWFLRLAGAASVGLAIRWLVMNPGSGSDLFWLGAHFAVSAMCMLGLAARLHGVTPRTGNIRDPRPQERPSPRAGDGTYRTSRPAPWSPSHAAIPPLFPGAGRAKSRPDAA
jgi:uncharacterized membrane protein HdeD (DUF308 family)